MTNLRDVPAAPAVPPRALRSDAARNHQVVLAAARRAYAEKGLHVGFDEIARRAGVGVGTVYRRFPDRDALLTALFEDRFEAVSALAETSTGIEDAWAGLEVFLVESVRMFSDDRGLREIMFDPTGKYAAITHERHRLGPLLAQVADRAHRAGVLRPDCRPEDLASIIAMLSSVTPPSLPAGQSGEWGGLAAAPRCTRFVLDGLRVGAVSPGSVSAGSVLPGSVLAGSVSPAGAASSDVGRSA